MSLFGLIEAIMCQSHQKQPVTVLFLDTGGFAQAFFSEKNRQAVIDLFCFDNDIDEENFRVFHQNVCITLRVISQTQKVDVEKFRTHNIRTNLIAVDMFSFMKCSETFHAVFGHSHHIIELNDCKGKEVQIVYRVLLFIAIYCKSERETDKCIHLKLLVWVVNTFVCFSSCLTHV